MSLKYFARYRFNGSDVAGEDFGLRDLAVESGVLNSVDDSVYGSCLEMDGATSLLSTGTFTGIADDVDRCFSFWAKNLNDNPNPVLCYGELSSPNAFVIYSRSGNGYPEFYDYSSRKSSETAIATGEWNFFTFCVSSGVLSIYVDGNLSYTSSLTLTTGTTDPLRLGTDGDGEYFKGYLLDVRIWDISLDVSVVKYMFSVGPNFQEELPSPYAEKYTRSAIVAGNVLCRSTYGVQEAGKDISQSFYCVDENSDLQEAARVEHSQDDFGVTSETIRVRSTNSSTNSVTLDETIKITPESTTFSTSTSSVIFSAEGVSVLSGDDDEKGSIFFGAGRDFRIRVADESFLVEAYSSTTGSYETKMKISS